MRPDRKDTTNGGFTIGVAVCICLIATAINIYTFQLSRPTRVLTFRDVAKMRQPNQFIGLEKVSPEGLGEAQPIVIYPNLLSRINRKKPTEVYGDDPVKFANWGGLVAPEDRPFQVDAEFSTIVEFYAVDYKMENCELVVRTPNSGDPRENVVDIWSLQHKWERLDIATLSWNTRPSRNRLIDTISLSSPPENYTYPFHCPLNSLHSFEFSARNHETSVGWSQNLSDLSPGVFMIQYPSA
ncbi:hypothetical protein E1B28_000719 [Marasmius oreades]|uniref:Ubiquitin 3 binding protein But2 C-terminal domain-containing protein n=1 Tax=Marasmius oreades TaxID=181124 RepID=A0A9P7V1Y0_9AGAR|nr:uncharacterized protein E1B28_000719 [Marasmius oreades]KAG7098814.1 hypothetical protein E1B28_000719 [Marasmius oreades]